MGEESSVISASEILRKYISEESTSEERLRAKTTFDALCVSFKNVSVWGKSDAMGVVLSQLLTLVSPLLDDRCNSLVENMLSVDLCELSDTNRQLWCAVMVQLVVEQNSSWGQLIVEKLFKRLCPDEKNLIDPDGSSRSVPLWPLEEYRAVSTDILHSLRQLMIGVPGLTSWLKTGVSKSFPYLKKPCFQLEAYFLNVLHFTTFSLPPDLLAVIWKTLIEKLVEIDSQLSLKAAMGGGRNEDGGMFALDEEMESISNRAIETDILALPEKMDTCLSGVLQFLQHWCFKNSSGSEGAEKLIKVKTTNKILDCLFDPMRRFVLGTHDLKHTPFIWFLLCSFDTKLCDKVLSYLWNHVETPVKLKQEQRQHDRIAHSSISYMAGLIARGEFVDSSTAKHWLKKWSVWANDYLTLWDSSGTGEPEEARTHGTFYAVCQAIFFVVAFKWEDFIGNLQEGLRDMEEWGLAKIVHSKLNPFQFCAPHVVRNFATVCRATQVVYCYHVLDRNRRRALEDKGFMNAEAPFESFFPFDPCELPRTSGIIKPLYRHYTGLSEDPANTAESELQWNKGRNKEPSTHNEDLGSWKDDVIISYGKSPGFMHSYRANIIDTVLERENGIRMDWSDNSEDENWWEN